MGLTMFPGMNLKVEKKMDRAGSHCATREEILKQGRIRAEVGPTVPPWMKLHAGKKFGRGGSHCTTREELERM